MPAKTTDAIHLLKDDHAKVKDLFDDFEKTEDSKERQDIAEKAMQELTIHTKIEEEIFYPAVRESTKDMELMDEAEEEHHVAKMLIEELKQMKATDEHFTAKFTVLAENVRHHIKEEEGEMLPKAKKSKVDMNELGLQMLQRKQELMQDLNAGMESSHESASRRHAA